MSYLVLARKYRPQTFDEVVGQEHIATTLKNAILTERVAHAYLFTGSRGVGKTSMARIFSKALNCPNAKKGEPCNKCEICRTISEGSDIDVVEIDGASHRGVEDVSVLRDGVKYMPSRSPHKIYIIDEVHMLTRHAFNALLKTLEEPPEHVKFIFATTEPNKVPDTILSRCQRFDFKRITSRDIVKRLGQIAEKEKVEVEEAALYQIARAATGGMRDSQSLLDQAISFGGKKLTAEQVAEILGVLPREQIRNLIKMLLEKDLPGVLTFVDEVYWSGTEPSTLVEQLMEAVRNLMVFSLLGGKARDLSGVPLEEEEWQELAGETDTDKLLLVLQVLTTTHQRLRRELQPRILLEMALVYLCRLGDMMALPEISTRLEKLPASPPGGATRSGGSGSPAGRRRSPDRPQASAGRPSGDEGSRSERSEKEDLSPPPQDGAPTIKDISGQWREVVDQLIRKFPLYSGSLEKSRVESINSKKLVLGLPTSQSFYREMLEKPATKKEIEAFLETITGKKLVLEFSEFEEKKITVENTSEVAEEVNLDLLPIVARAVEIFHGSLVREKKIEPEPDEDEG